MQMHQYLAVKRIEWSQLTREPQRWPVTASDQDSSRMLVEVGMASQLPEQHSIWSIIRIMQFKMIHLNTPLRSQPSAFSALKAKHYVFFWNTVIMFMHICLSLWETQQAGLSGEGGRGPAGQGKLSAVGWLLTEASEGIAAPRLGYRPEV